MFVSNANLIFYQFLILSMVADLFIDRILDAIYELAWAFLVEYMPVSYDFVQPWY